MELREELERLLVQRYTEAVMTRAKVPTARRPDVEEAPHFSASQGEIRCTCAITGSTYIEPWNGSEETAVAFADEVGEMTAGLVAQTKKHHHHAWLYSTR